MEEHPVTSKWSDFGNMWGTLRELDVSAIRDEAERSLTIVCVGHQAALDAIDQLLHSNDQKFGPAGADPLVLVPLAQTQPNSAPLNNADMLIFGVDARTPLSESESQAFDQLEQLSLPFVVVLFYGTRSTGAPLPRSINGQTVAIADPQAPDAAERLAQALLERLPGELHLSAARRLPGLRAAVGRNLVNTTSFTNATYALASGLPEQIPIISIPFAAADMLVLTKNQALMVYRLALAYGAPPDFQARIREVIPVVGGAFLWRQAARSLIGLIPIWGLVPKIAIAYAGTYTTGVAASRWFASGEMTSPDQLKRMLGDAMARGRERAREIVARARPSKAIEEGDQSDTNQHDGLGARIRRLLPGRHNQGDQ
jgi:uncharacterized protein (DUF697 family)